MEERKAIQFSCSLKIQASELLNQSLQTWDNSLATCILAFMWELLPSYFVRTNLSIGRGREGYGLIESEMPLSDFKVP